MGKRMHRFACTLGLLLLGLAPVLAEPVTEWNFSQSDAGNYEQGEEGAARFMRPWLPRPEGHAALTRSFSARDFHGQRIRLAGTLKTEEAERVEIVISAASGDKADIVRLAVGDGRTAGTMDWRGYELVVDVPDDAARLVIGLQTTGKGTVWVKDFSLEVVGANVAVTASASPWNMPQRQPVNTSFDP